MDRGSTPWLGRLTGAPHPAQAIPRTRLDPLAKAVPRPPYRFTPTGKKLFKDKTQTSLRRAGSKRDIPTSPRRSCSCQKTVRVDYRAVSKATRKDHYPLPRIDDSTERQHGARRFLKLGLADSFASRRQTVAKLPSSRRKAFL